MSASPVLPAPPAYGSLENSRIKDEASEASWTDSIEDYLRNIRSKCEDASSAHNEAGYKQKALNGKWAFPAMLIPSVSAPIMGAFKDQDWIAYFGMGSMCVTAVCTGFSTFFRFGEKSQAHFNYAGRYADVVTDIDEILAKPSSKRASGTVVMRTIRMQYDSLSLSAPET